MWKSIQIAATVLVAGLLLAVVAENVALHYRLGPHSLAAADPSAPPTSAPTGDASPGASPAPPAMSAPKPPSHAQPMRVTYVWDGDTIELQADESGDIVTSLAKVPVRLIGVDTPEIESQRRDEPSECYGDEATDFVRDLLPVDTLVLVDRDRSGWDDFDRRLLYVWRADDGHFVNYELVAQGYGEAIRVWPNVAYWDQLQAAERMAKRDRLGMWGAC
jgi:micrococcal nuclease